MRKESRDQHHFREEEGRIAWRLLPSTSSIEEGGGEEIELASKSGGREKDR